MTFLKSMKPEEIMTMNYDHFMDTHTKRPVDHLQCMENHLHPLKDHLHGLMKILPHHPIQRPMVPRQKEQKHIQIQVFYYKFIAQLNY